MQKRKLKILIVSSEVAGYARTGGLADVARALPKELARQGHTVAVVMPYYGFIKDQDFSRETVAETVPITISDQTYQAKYVRTELEPGLSLYFIANHDFFGRHSKLYGYPYDNLRFMFFDRAALELVKYLDWLPDIIHCHDWHTGLIPNYLN